MGRAAGDIDPRDDPQTLRIGGYLKRSTVNGPGVRSVIWVQGCPLRCDGCFNRDLWDYRDGKNTDIGQLAGEIAATQGIAGVTFSGGEPFAQAAGLAALGKLLHRENLSVVTFTGFSYDALILKGRTSWNRLLEQTDLLIAGPYRHDLRCSHPLLSSSNQQIHTLTSRIALPPAFEGPGTTTVEYTISPCGTLYATGFPAPALQERMGAIGSAKGR